MTTASISIALLSTLACLVCRCHGFMLHHGTTINRCHPRAMVGGKGWENNSFLDSLGGNDQDREQAKQDYDDFKETREAFSKRQQERLNTPEGQRFVQQQQAQMQSRINQDNNPNMGSEDPYGDVGTSSGGSAFRKMMQRSQQMQQKGRANGPASFIDPMTGMEQSLAVPLEPDDFSKSKEQKKVDDSSGGEWSDVE